MARWIKKQDPTICCLQETHLGSKDKHRFNMKGWKMTIQASSSQKKAGLAILLLKKKNRKQKKKEKKKGNKRQG